MNIKVGSYEAKTKLPELLRGVQAGNHYTITLRGEAVAELVPAHFDTSPDKGAAVDDMLAFMKKRKTSASINLMASSRKLNRNVLWPCMQAWTLNLMRPQGCRHWETFFNWLGASSCPLTMPPIWSCLCAKACLCPHWTLSGPQRPSPQVWPFLASRDSKKT